MQLETGLCDFEFFKKGHKITLGCVLDDGEIKKLTGLQTRLLTVLLNNFDDDVPIDDLCELVWNNSNIVDTRPLRVHVHALRNLLRKKDKNYVISYANGFVSLTYFRPMDKLEDTKRTLVKLLKKKSPESVTDTDLELIKLLTDEWV